MEYHLLAMKISYWNIEGLHDKTHGCKIPYLSKHFQSDIEVLSETWSSCKDQKDIDGYSLFEINAQKDSNIKKGRKSGGILIYYKNYLKNSMKILKRHKNYVWIEVSKNALTNINANLKICAIYNPPENSRYHNSSLMDDISADILSMTSKNDPFILIGDMNARIGTTNDFDNDKGSDELSNLTAFTNPGKTRKNCDSTINAQGNKIINLCKKLDLMILNGRTSGDFWGNFTHYNNNGGASTVDLSILPCNMLHHLRNFKVDPQLEISSHCKITVEIDNPKLYTKRLKKSYNWIDLQPNFIWKNTDKESYTEVFNSSSIITKIEQTTQFLDAGLIKSAGEKIQETFQVAANLCIERKPNVKVKTSKKKSKSKKKWYDEECKKFKNRVRYSSTMKNKFPLNPEVKMQHHNLLKSYKKMCSSKKSSFWKAETSKLIHKENENFWDTWKNLGENIKIDENLDDADPNVWHDYFRNLYKQNEKLDDTWIKNTGNPNNQTNSELNQPFELEELTNVIKKLKKNKASGLDRINNEMLKHAPKAILTIILRFFNLCLEKGIITEKWCLGIITPLHKEGPKSQPDNYRGICIMNSLLKLLCSILNERLYNYVLKKQIINKGQIGFLKNNRTTDHIFTLKSIINKYVYDKKSKLYACFIDFKKAFDSVNHKILFKKLEEIKVGGIFLDLLKDIYNKTRCALKINKKLTQFFNYEKGVIQGNPISPLLFNIYINGIFDKLKNAKCDPVSLNGNEHINALMFADDLICLSTTKEGLQRSLDALYQYSNKCGLEVNMKKTKCISFAKGTRKEIPKFTLNNEDIELTNDYKYLGITINKKGNFTPTLTNLSNRATRAIYAVYSKIDKKIISPHTQLKLFDHLIAPILLYGSEIWAPYLNLNPDKWENNEIEKVHNQFMKRCLGVNRSTTNALVKGELGRYSLQEKIIFRNWKYVSYIKAKNDESLVKQAYEYEMSKKDTRITITSSLDKLEEQGDDGNQLDLEILSEFKFKQEIRNIFESEWKKNIKTFSKAETYRLFKTAPKMEPYLKETQNFRHRTCITKFRLSDHNLKIEEGRRCKPKIDKENRICIECNKVEDEVHFLIDCKKYTEERNDLFAKIASIYPNFNKIPDSLNKFIFLMSQENVYLTKILASTIFSWLKIRDI